MSEQQVAEIEELRARLVRLEAAAKRPRGATNMVGAAQYLGRSEEWLRQQHALGRGPRRTRSGSRYWTYQYPDLDEFLETGAA
jgi:hypothetical protein